MKHQYFGDVNDYQKYGLLRLLAKVGGLRLGIAWMLTPDDDRTDGRKTAYLSQASRWRRNDPDLFDFLQRQVITATRRDMSSLEGGGMIPNSVYHSDHLGDGLANRTEYLDRMLAKFTEVDLIFIDPDNGFEIKSCPMGRKGSSKFIAFSEVETVYRAGMSALIFQHFPRVKRTTFIPAQMEKLGLATGAARVISLETANVLYLFAAACDHLPEIRHSLRVLDERWPGQFKVLTMTATSGPF